MAQDRFYIGPYDENSGQDNSVKPYMIPDNAFASLRNAYVYRGRVTKRFGSRWMGSSQLESRLRMALTPTGDTVTTFSNVAVGQMFSIGTDVFTVNDITAMAMLLSTSGVTAQLTAANQVTFSAIAGTVYWYPALPVMGLLTRETSSENQEAIVGFDTKYSYSYTDASGWDRIGTATWTGTDAQFFWGANWQGTDPNDLALFVTNFNSTDRIRYLIGSTWATFDPTLSTTPSTIKLTTALILVVFKNRLVALNTVEGGTSYRFRARYSGVGSPLAADAWNQDIPGNGNFIDAATQESIISAEFVKDRLIVFFERSTWELAYTGNQVYPFTWQKINTELGVESTFSIVPFDRVALGVGNVGIHACNGSNVERIDSKIPDAVFDIHNDNDGPQRVYGIRDYRVEMIYWTFPSPVTSPSFKYPNQVLVYNYGTGTWSFNDDSITCFGFYQPSTAAAAGVTWDSTIITWDSDESWGGTGGGANQAYYRFVVAGNQQGYTFIVDPKINENAPALQITDLSVSGNVVTVTAYDHNLRQKNAFRVQGIQDDGNLGTLLNGYVFIVQSDTFNDNTPNTFTFIYDLTDTALSGTYEGGGYISLVSNPTILTKQYNFYAQQGRNFTIDKIDFFVTKTSTGATTVNTYVGSSTNGLIGASSQLGTSVLETSPYPAFPWEANAARFWHPVYFEGDGESVQFELKMTNEQLTDVTKVTEPEGDRWVGPAFEDFEIFAMMIYAQPTSSRFQ